MQMIIDTELGTHRSAS